MRTHTRTRTRKTLQPTVRCTSRVCCSVSLCSGPSLWSLDRNVVSLPDTATCVYTTSCWGIFQSCMVRRARKATCNSQKDAIYAVCRLKCLFRLHQAQNLHLQLLPADHVPVTLLYIYIYIYIHKIIHANSIRVNMAMTSSYNRNELLWSHEHRQNGIPTGECNQAMSEREPWPMTVTDFHRISLITISQSDPE